METSPCCQGHFTHYDWVVWRQCSEFSSPSLSLAVELLFLCESAPCCVKVQVKHHVAVLWLGKHGTYPFVWADKAVHYNVHRGRVLSDSSIAVAVKSRKNVMGDNVGTMFTRLIEHLDTPYSGVFSPTLTNHAKHLHRQLNVLRVFVPVHSPALSAVIGTILATRRSVQINAHGDALSSRPLDCQVYVFSATEGVRR